jgi:hypothetical protein
MLQIHTYHDKLIARAGSVLRAWERDLGIDASTAKAIVAFPILVILMFCVFLALPMTRASTLMMLEENQHVELLTFVCFLLAGWHGLILARRTRRLGYRWPVTLFYTAFSLGLIFAAMEEVSWGQWFLGFDTPKILEEINQQREVNIHNLPLFHEYLEVPLALYGFGGLFGILISRHQYVRWLSPPHIMTSWFLVIAVHSIFSLLHEVDVYFSREFGWLVNQLDEVVEMLLAVSAWVYIWLNSKRLSSRRGEIV